MDIWAGRPNKRWLEPSKTLRFWAKRLMYSLSTKQTVLHLTAESKVLSRQRYM